LVLPARHRTTTAIICALHASDPQTKVGSVQLTVGSTQLLYTLSKGVALWTPVPQLPTASCSTA